MNKGKLLLFVIAVLIMNLLALDAAAQVKEAHSTKSSTSLSHAFCFACHFLAKSSYPAAASVQAAGAAPCGTAQRHGDFPSGRP